MLGLVGAPHKIIKNSNKGKIMGIDHRMRELKRGLYLCDLEDPILLRNLANLLDRVGKVYPEFYHFQIEKEAWDAKCFLVFDFKEEKIKFELNDRSYGPYGPYSSLSYAFPNLDQLIFSCREKCGSLITGITTEAHRSFGEYTGLWKIKIGAMSPSKRSYSFEKMMSLEEHDSVVRLVNDENRFKKDIRFINRFFDIDKWIKFKDIEKYITFKKKSKIEAIDFWES